MTARHAALVGLLALALAGCGTAVETVAAPQAATSSPCQVRDGKAQRSCTPGAVNPAVTQATIRDTICRKGWTDTVRPPTSVTRPMERASMTRYGQTGLRPSDVEYDHLIPLGVGGATGDPANLYPQPYAGPGSAYTKDGDERSLNRAVCSGRKTLAAAQAEIVREWTW